MQKLIVLVFFFLANNLVNAQGDKYMLLFEKPLKPGFSFFTIDHLGDEYQIINNEVVKLGNSRQKRSYKNVLLGTVSSIDVRNPLQIVLFYKNFNSIVLLDNQLSEIAVYNLSDFFPQLDVKSVSSAQKNSVWIFDNLSKRIYLLDLTQMALNSVSVSLEQEVTVWNSDANFYYWTDGTSFNRCDRYGKVTVTPISFAFDAIIAIDQNTIFYQQERKFYIWKVKEQKKEEIMISEDSVERGFLNNQILTIFTKESVYIFTQNNI